MKTLEKINYRIFQLFDLFRWMFSVRNFLIKDSINKKKNVAFVELCTMSVTVRVNCLLALALNKENYNIFVILKEKSLYIELFYKLIGVKNFIYLGNKNDTSVRKNAELLFLKLNSSKKFLNFIFQSIAIGKFIGSRILMNSKSGTFRLKDIDSDVLINHLYESLLHLKNFEKVLLKTPFELMIFNERGYSPVGEIFESALKKKIKCVQWFGSPLDNHNCFKGYNWNNRKDHPLTLSKYTFQKLLNLNKKNKFAHKILQHLENHYHSGKWFNRQNLQINKKIFSKIELKKILGISNDNKICVIFTHIFDDATFFYGKDLFESYEDWLKNIIYKIKELNNINWIIKVHPANMLKSNYSLEEKLLDRIIKIIPNHIKIVRPNTPINTFSFFGSIDYGLTVRGTVGCELACYGIPVITAGNGRYSGEGFTIDPKSKEEFYKYIENLGKIEKLNKHKINLAQVYTYGSLVCRSIKMHGINIKYTPEQFIKNNLIKVPKDQDDLMSKYDISKFISWVKNDIKYDLIELNENEISKNI